MTETESKFKISVLGSEEAKRTFRDTKKAIDELNKFSSRTQNTGIFSQKQLSTAAKAMQTLNKEYANTKNAIKALSDVYNKLEARLSSLVKKQKEFAEGSRKWNKLDRVITEVGRRQGAFGSELDKAKDLDLQTRRAASGYRQASREGQLYPQEEGGGLKGAGMAMLTRYAGPAAIAAMFYNSWKQSGKFQSARLDISPFSRGTNLLTQKRGLEESGFGAGYSPFEAAQTAMTLARSGVRPELTTIRSALYAKRAFGIDDTSLSAFAGTQTRAGKDFNPLTLKNIIQDAFASGLSEARFDEFISSVSDMSQSLQRFGVNAGGANISQALSAIGGAGVPSLQGGRGAAALSAIQSGIQNPNSIAMSNLVMQAGGLFSGRASYADIMRAKEEGVSTKRGRDLMTNTMNLLTTRYAGGDKDMASLLMTQAFPGMGWHTADDWRKTGATKRLAGLGYGNRGDEAIPDVIKQQSEGWLKGKMRDLANLGGVGAALSQQQVGAAAGTASLELTNDWLQRIYGLISSIATNGTAQQAAGVANKLGQFSDPLGIFFQKTDK